MNRTKKITYLGMGIALYVVLSMTIKIPLINQIKTDFGYLAFGAFLNLFGMPATVVGVAGCIIANSFVGSAFPPGWVLGQLFVGLFCGYLFGRTEKLWLKCIIAVSGVFIGIGIIKTFIEVWLFRIPFNIKIIRNLVAFVADVIPMVIGVIISTKIRLR